ncbi:centaurin-gamma-1A isoform X1 [Phlebotomus papatasi]|uniref:centaurin-gamma-1A isoform X1 n=2 Tax=Phlebotomus papatasi TaxID=29031 RepID=UPI002483524B|nr:centaurin-gamma-1A isoform X1 [Phlebotomus papatasi]
MNSRPHLQSFLTNSLAIRQEIQRFESVHPSIYAIYDLIELIQDQQIAQQIRDHVVCIEDSFVNSQEWTISRSVPDLRLGIVGSLSSGKSALVHRYLTGSYMQEESPEGGRFKKEVFIDNQSYLLLIRDEGGPPEMQFAAWVDAVIFVFSLENEASFNAVYNYFTKMSHFRNSSEIPIILVGTQDAISERSPRVIDDVRARKLASDLKWCSYYETCATYGLNVERVFHDACQKIVQHRLGGPQPPHTITPTNSRPTTPQGTRLGVASYHGVGSPTNGFTTSSGSPASNATLSSASPSHISASHGNLTLPHRHHALSASSHHIPIRISADLVAQGAVQDHAKWGTISHGSSQQALVAIAAENNNIAKFAPQAVTRDLDNFHQVGGNTVAREVTPKELPTPTSTPTTSRKSRRRSNLFIPSSKKSDEKLKNGGELGSGRAIPLKQGYLYKRSSKSLNKEWKKKYVTLCDDGRLTYHPSLHDYMDDVHGKEIQLQLVTVKVPGQKPRGSKSIITNSALTAIKAHANGLTEGLGGLSLAKEKKEKVLLTAYDTLKEPGKSNSQTSGDEGIALSNSNSQTFINETAKVEAQTPNVKKRHRRMKSSGVKNNEYDDSDGFEFYIVSLGNKQWHFEAANSEERDEWVAAIEQEIFKTLQGNESTKSKQQNSSTDLASMQLVRSRVPGNSHCVDCDEPNPEWASLNLGVVMCIECSGVHRNLGSHISKVRSLGLDEWPPGHLSVMLAIGNSLANSVWEANVPRGRAKPGPGSTREEKEAWIRSKYEAKEFIQTPPQAGNVAQQLTEAIFRPDMRSIILLLAHATPEQINTPLNARDLRTPLHVACGVGNLAITQLLIWYNANIKQLDQDGRTCLTHAREALSVAATSIKANSSGLQHHHQYSLEATSALVELLVGLGCPDAQIPVGTLSRRRETFGQAFEKLPSSVI